MAAKPTNPYAELERIFHEPHRMAIMSGLLGAPEGLTFTALKTSCELTDGNLSRHLKALEEARAVTMRKRFVRNRPQTTVHLTKHGRESFLHYLQALEAVLKEAARKLSATRKAPGRRIIPLSPRLADT